MIAVRGRLWLVAFTAGCTVAVVAPAQDDERSYYPRDTSMSVTERQHPELDPHGLPVGSFLLLPSITTGIVYDDNVYASSTDRTSDGIATIAVDFDLKSTWSRNAAALHAGIDREQYINAGNQSTTNYHLGADGRLDVGDGNVALSAETARFTQSRSDVDAPNAAVKPIRYQRTVAVLSGEQEFGRLRVSALADWRRYRFDDARTATGTLLDQSFRNRDVTTGDLRVDYALSPRIAVYVDGAVNQRSYQIRTLGAPSRDSHGYTIEAGADFDLTNLARGHVQFGYLSQTGKSGVWSAQGFSGRGKVEWFATPLVTVTFEGGRTVQDSAELDTPAYVSTDIGARIDYELLRNLIITARATAEWDRFKTTGQRARRTLESLGARYRMNRNFVLEAGYQHLSQRPSGNPGLADFSDNRLMLTLRLQK